jgi:hypothetical protein
MALNAFADGTLALECGLDEEKSGHAVYYLAWDQGYNRKKVMVPFLEGWFGMSIPFSFPNLMCCFVLVSMVRWK